MSVLIYPVFEKKLEFKTETTGEFLGKYFDELEELADKLNVKPLSFFDSLNHNEELRKAFENYDGKTDPQDIIDSIPHKDIWFSAEECIQTLDAFLKYYEKRSEKKGLTEELKDLKKVLELASRKKLKFQLKTS